MVTTSPARRPQIDETADHGVSAMPRWQPLPAQFVLGRTARHARAIAVALLQEGPQDVETLHSRASRQSASAVRVFIEAAKFIVSRSDNPALTRHPDLIQ
jgi:hypothetical protein